MSKICFQSVTKFLLVSAQVFALGWVSLSYLIAFYATVKLGQPYPVVELSQHAITVILGTNAMKMLENLVEWNNGGLFGTSIKTEGISPPESV